MNCTLSFESDAELEEHMLSSLHTVPKSLTSLDKVRNSFVYKMKITSQLNMPTSSSSNSASALPVRSSSRFSNQQKELLYKYFIRGEESGNKMSPEQVRMQLRRELPPDQYVTSQQIRSLFSRFSNLKRKGKLVEPTTKNNENSQVNDNKEVYGKNDDFNLTGDNEDDNKYKEDIANLAKEICLVWKVNDWVAVPNEKQWNIGYIVEVSITGIRVNCMINGQEKNTFRWPVTTEEINNQTDKIICLCDSNSTAIVHKNHLHEGDLTRDIDIDLNSSISINQICPATENVLKAESLEYHLPSNDELFKLNKNPDILQKLNFIKKHPIQPSFFSNIFTKALF
nr:uncharacterized protein LOC124816344 [Hydra vulgaris]